MKNFRDLKVWEKAHLLALAIYRVTSGFPKDDNKGLTSQMRRSAASIPTNIAEGCGRGGDAKFARFAQIAMGSASELEYQILLAHDLKLLTDENHDQLANNVTEVKRMLTALIQKLKADR